MAFRPSLTLFTKHIPFNTPLSLYSHYRSHLQSRSHLPRRRFKPSRPRITALNKHRQRYLAVHPMSVDPSLDRTAPVQMKERGRHSLPPTLDGAVLTDRQELRYRLERAAGWTGAFAEEVDERSRRLVWLAGQKARRSRVRGGPVAVVRGQIRQAIRDGLAGGGSQQQQQQQAEDKKEEGEQEGQGQDRLLRHSSQKLIYLPNIAMAMMRNHTPPGERYDPFTATFRVNKSVTKHDIKNLLHAVYGVQTTFIRTSIRIGRIVRQDKRRFSSDHAGRFVRSGGIKVAFKRAVVGLVEPFFYPAPLKEDLLDKYFNVTKRRDREAISSKLQLKAMGMPRPPPGWNTRISAARSRRSAEIRRDLGQTEGQNPRVVALALQNRAGVRQE